mmetsp:Transcript_3253/g.10133  ORF Transcript_3253/g.10133 Transcript_3253/m.10133 type:complete len:263 (-) Transcript_3253:1424-2212(-)
MGHNGEREDVEDGEGDGAVGGARRRLEHAQQVVPVDAVRGEHEGRGEGEEQRNRWAEHRGEEDHLEGELITEGQVQVGVKLVPLVHLCLRRRMQRTHAACEQLLGPHKLDDAKDDGEVAEEAIHQHEGARRVPVRDAECVDVDLEQPRPAEPHVRAGESRTRAARGRRGQRASGVGVDVPREEEEGEDGDRGVEDLEEGHLEQHVHVLVRAVMVPLTPHGKVGDEVEDDHVGCDDHHGDPHRRDRPARMRSAHEIGHRDGGR